ncbi:MAG: DUF4124 domain-containing protein [bacterium]|nr:DUF4124 domain-containing protein [bacterium]
MLKVKTGLRFGKSLLGAFLIAGLAGPAFAGNVYSWVTEDGTYAFTDDPKRIPAKHRTEAKKRPMGKLTRYERFTEVSSKKGKPYADRIRQRQAEFREMTATAPQGAVVGAMTPRGTGIGYTIPVTGGGSSGGRSASNLWVPVGDSTSVDSAPTIIESKRMRSDDSLATRHWTFVKKGDQIEAVIKGERRQRPLKAASESEFDL